MEENKYENLKDINTSLRDVKKIKKEIYKSYEYIKNKVSEHFTRDAIENLILFKIIKKQLNKISDKSKFYEIFSVDNDKDLEAKINKMGESAEKIYIEIKKITNISFEDFLNQDKSLKELNDLLIIKEQEAKLRCSTNCWFWSIFILMFVNLFGCLTVLYFNKLWLSITYTIIFSGLIIAFTSIYIYFKKKINKIDKRNIYDKLSSIPIFFLGIMINILFIFSLWDINIANSIALLVFTIIYNIFLITTTIGSIITNSKLLNNKFEILSISLLASTILLIIENFSDAKELKFVSILYKIALGILCIIWTISILYTSFFSIKLKKSQYKHFYIFIISVLITIALWYYLIYELFYNTIPNANNTLFNSVITVFSAICGGLLTLGGVAWTIKNENQKTRNEKYSNILLTLDCKLKMGQNENFVLNSQNRSCNYYIISEKNKIDKYYFDMIMYYKSTNYPLNKINILNITANKNTGFDKIDFVLDETITTNIVQVDEDIYSFELVFTGKECVSKLKDLINKNEFILNISLELISIIDVVKNLDIEINFEGIKITPKKEKYKLNNVTYKFEEEL